MRVISNSTVARVRKFLLAATTLLMLSACAGSFNGLSGDPVEKVFVTSSSGTLSADQWVVAQYAAAMTNAQIDVQMSSPIEAAATSGAAYGVGYAAGGSLQGRYYPSPAATAGTVVNGITGLWGGAVNGVQMYSSASVIGTGYGAEQALRDWEKNVAIPPELLERYPNIRTLVAGVHIQPAYVRSTSSTNKPADGLVPKWSGPPVGSPVFKKKVVEPKPKDASIRSEALPPPR